MGLQPSTNKGVVVIAPIGFHETSVTPVSAQAVLTKPESSDHIFLGPKSWGFSECSNKMNSGRINRDVLMHQSVISGATFQQCLQGFGSRNVETSIEMTIFQFQFPEIIEKHPGAMDDMALPGLAHHFPLCRLLPPRLHIRHTPADPRPSWCEIWMDPLVPRGRSWWISLNSFPRILEGSWKFYGSF